MFGCYDITNELPRLSLKSRDQAVMAATANENLSLEEDRVLYDNDLIVGFNWEDLLFL